MPIDLVENESVRQEQPLLRAGLQKDASIVLAVNCDQALEVAALCPRVFFKHFPVILH